MKRIAVFCGSRDGARPVYRELAVSLVDRMAERGIGLVYGGGRVGLMGAIADRMLSRGGEVIGVIPGPLLDWEVAHRGVADLRVVASMHERKALMADLSDGFIALPGGIGTLDETCEVLTWAQLGIHDKPIGLLDAEGYWDTFRALMNHIACEGFLRGALGDLMVSETDPARLLQEMAQFRAPPRPRWVSREER